MGTFSYQEKWLQCTIEMYLWQSFPWYLGEQQSTCAVLFFLTVYGLVISQPGNIVCSQVYIDSNETHHLHEWSVI